MKFVFKEIVGRGWTNICKIENDTDWDALSFWLNPEQIQRLKKEGSLVIEEYVYTVASNLDTIEFLTNIPLHFH